MIELPASPAPASVSPELMDYGVVLRPGLGGAVQKVDRAGSRYRVAFTYPPMPADDARKFVSRLNQAKLEGGLRMKMRLAGIDQSGAGSPVVDGAGQAGTLLSIRGLTPGYALQEGFWLTIFDASGQPYLHNCRSEVTADGSGDAAIVITPPLRIDFADGATIELNAPVVEGFIDGGAIGWSVDTAYHFGIGFTIEEAA